MFKIGNDLHCIAVIVICYKFGKLDFYKCDRLVTLQVDSYIYFKSGISKVGKLVSTNLLQLYRVNLLNFGNLHFESPFKFWKGFSLKFKSTNFYNLSIGYYYISLYLKSNAYKLGSFD